MIQYRRCKMRKGVFRAVFEEKKACEKAINLQKKQGKILLFLWNFCH